MTESFSLQSSVDNMPVVEERLYHFCQENNIGSFYSTLCVATMQAVKNAIEHGNKNNDELTVDVEFGHCRGGVYVRVSDCGVGFDYQRFATEEMPTSGNGIFIMQRLADAVVFSNDGRTVRMEFVVDGIALDECVRRISVLQHFFQAVAA